MRYGSVCSGIEAATVAWAPIGWKAAWFAEIEKFPSAVLAARWPEVSNLGDMTKIAAAVRAGEVEAPDVLVGGTPCQAFSIAGLRNGLADARGQLTLSYVELADAIDDKRREAGEEEAIIVWENVPGVLSSKDNAFGCFLAGLAGEDEAIEPGDRPAAGKSNQFWRWSKKAGHHIAAWPQRGCVYGPQRALAWGVRDAQYFGVAQRRKRVFVVASARAGFDPAEVLFEFDGVRRDTPPSRSTGKAVAALTARGVGTCGADDNQAQAGHLQPVVGAISANSFTGGAGGRPEGAAAGHFIPYVQGCNGEVSHTLKGEGFDGSEDGTGRGVPVVAFGGGNTSGSIDVAACLTAKGQRIDFEVETFAVHGTQDPDVNREFAHTIGRNNGGENVVFGKMQVRRLTPVECERLQGFPDDHASIAWRGKEAAECPDGPRYKAIGNSMAVPVMRWIGERITAALPVEKAAPRAWQRPFLKWAGGKYSLMPELDRLIPAGARLIEPFVGGGSVFINSDKHESFLLGDANPDLINLYQMLAVVPEHVTLLARQLFAEMSDEPSYFAVRQAFNAQQMTGPERAAALLYLNRHCFNGLIRYNRAGEFNVGWGKKANPYFPDKELLAFAAVAPNCVFMNAGYRRTLSLAGEGDIVYCDPPYEPLPGTAGFTNYAAGGFAWADQVSLVESCVAAHQRGARVVISNSTAPRIIELYEQHGFTLHHVSARRSISSKGSTRENAADIVAIL